MDVTVDVGTTVITIRASTLMKGRYYKLLLFANTYKSAVASAEYTFFTNCPPYAGSCTVTPRSGMSNAAQWYVECRVDLCMGRAARGRGRSGRAVITGPVQGLAGVVLAQKF